MGEEVWQVNVCKHVAVRTVKCQVAPRKPYQDYKKANYAAILFDGSEITMISIVQVKMEQHCAHVSGSAVGGSVQYERYASSTLIRMLEGSGITSVVR